MNFGSCVQFAGRGGAVIRGAEKKIVGHGARRPLTGLLFNDLEPAKYTGWLIVRPCASAPSRPGVAFV